MTLLNEKILYGQFIVKQSNLFTYVVVDANRIIKLVNSSNDMREVRLIGKNIRDYSFTEIKQNYAARKKK